MQSSCLIFLLSCALFSSSTYAALVANACYKLQPIGQKPVCPKLPDVYVEMRGLPGPQGKPGVPGGIDQIYASFERRINSLETSLANFEKYATDESKNLAASINKGAGCYKDMVTYHIEDTRLGFYEAMQNCKALGGELAHHGVSTKLLRRNVILSNGGALNGGYWLGLTDAAKEGEWRYLDGRIVDKATAGWARGQPNLGRKENCGLLYNSEELHDAPCRYAQRSICEIRMCPAPAPVPKKCRS